jgi:hypothetical protein
MGGNMGTKKKVAATHEQEQAVTMEFLPIGFDVVAALEDIEARGARSFGYQFFATCFSTLEHKKPTLGMVRNHFRNLVEAGCTEL